MGDNAVILQGAHTEPKSAESWQQKQSLFSTVHGAGRVMSRGKARKTIVPQEMADWIEERGVIVRGGDLDEAPHAYRRLDEVLEAQGPTIEILHELRPLIVCMAPKQEKRRR